MGRAGRSVLIVTVIAGMIIALMIVATRTAGASDGTMAAPEPSPPPWFGGRVELPQHGFAVTVPETWVAFDLGDDIKQQALEYSAAAGEQAAPASETTRFLTSARDQGMRFWAIEPELASSCGAGLNRAPAGGLPEVAAFVHERMRSEYAMTDVEEPWTVGLLQLGGFAVAGRIPADDVPVGVPIMYYLLAPDEDPASSAWLLLVTCTGAERPEDDWLSIVETFEFLPSAE